MITLSLNTAYRSIRQFAGVSLPEFTVLTGKNGSGKTHLLEAIARGAITVEGVESNERAIKLITFSSITLPKSSAVEPAAHHSERKKVVEAIEKSFNQLRVEFLRAVGRVKPPIIAASFPEAISRAREALLDPLPEAEPTRRSGMFGGPQTHIVAAKQRIASINAALRVLDQGCDRVFDSLRGAKNVCVTSASETGRHVCELTYEELNGLIPLKWEAVNLFQQDFSRLFGRYYGAWDGNRYDQYANLVHGEQNPFFSDTEFVSRFGEPPWDFVNQVLQTARLDYEMTKPEGRSTEAYQAKLINKLSGSEVSFQDLSSGEKVILSFALCLYNVNHEASLLQLPSLLLLDEIDAPLHPSMTRDLIRVVHDVLVRQQGLKVIFTTHSPSTVAFAPDESIYSIQPGTGKISKLTKENAIKLLTSGYITVTESSRFVLAEAKYDRLIYTKIVERLYLDQQLSDTPRLVFIQASDRKNETGGREVVKQWGTKLAAAGLNSVLGLIDRDEANQATATIKVLSRYSLENFLLDPIVCYAVLVHHGEHAKVFNVGVTNRNYYDLRQLTNDRLQQIANAITTVVENFQPTLADSAETFDVRYVGGHHLKLPVWLRDHRGHDLVNYFREAFRVVIDNSFVLTRNDCGDLVEMMTERIPEFIPCEFVEVFKSLQIAGTQPSAGCEVGGDASSRSA